MNWRDLQDENRVDTDSLIEKYGDRKAFEWFVRAEDRRYHLWEMRIIREKFKKITILVGVSTVISISSIMAIVVFLLLGMYR